MAVSRLKKIPQENSGIRHADVIARDLAEGISTGRFPVGALLPTELELCTRYEASRYTVRMALADLQKLGLVSRRKSVGTRVEAAKPAAGFTQSSPSVDDIAQFGAPHVRVLGAVQELVADLALAHELGCQGGSRWLRISYLRVDDGKKNLPIGCTDVYVDASYSDIGEMVQAAPEMLISSLIETRYGRRVAQIQQDIKPVLISRAVADMLQVDENSPALQVVRRYLDANEVAFEISVTVHPLDRFAFSMKLNRTGE
jgi:DNA-binding GntR family transcriptional regulator